MGREEWKPRPTPDYIGAPYGEGYTRKPEAAKPERKVEQGPTRDLTHPEVMVHLEALVDAQRKQREAQAELATLDAEKEGAGQHIKRKVLEAQWKAAEESLHAAAMRASQALGLGEKIGQRVEPATIPAPVIPKQEVPAPPLLKRRPGRPASEERVAA